MKPHTDTARADADMAHREYFAELTGEPLEWTPALDACLRTYFQLQFDSAESHPVEVMTSFGHCLGIAETLLAVGLITDRQRRHLDGLAACRAYEKVRPWDGCEFTVSAGHGRPDGITSPTPQ